MVLTLCRKGIVSTKIAWCELWEQIMARAGEYGARVFLVGAH